MMVTSFFHIFYYFVLTDISSAPIDIVWVEVEDIFERGRGIEHVARCRVHHPLGFASRARGIEDEDGIFPGHPLNIT